MNLVKKSLYLCIGVLLLLIGIQGAQSLWQVSRLSGAADDIVHTSKLSHDSRAIWSQFLDTEQAFRQTIAFVDAENAEAQRKAFNAKATALREDAGKLRQGATGDLKAPAEAMVSKVDAWLAPFRRLWSTHLDALERHLDRIHPAAARKGKTRRKK